MLETKLTPNNRYLLRIIRRHGRKVYKVECLYNSKGVLKSVSLTYVSGWHVVSSWAKAIADIRCIESITGAWR